VKLFLALTLFAVGGTLLYSGVIGRDPREEVALAFGGKISSSGISPPNKGNNNTPTEIGRGQGAYGGTLRGRPVIIRGRA